MLLTELEGELWLEQCLLWEFVKWTDTPFAVSMLIPGQWKSNPDF